MSERFEIKNTKLWSDYLNAKSYADTLGISSKIPECVKFYEGNQWAAVTELTKNMPRPVLNFIEMIVNTKVSNVLSSPVKLNFVADNDDVATEIVTNFVDYILKEIGMEELDFLYWLFAAIKGTSIKHYYWDETAEGTRGNYEGGVRCELIDPLNVVFSNPKEIDEQKQKWIIIVSRVDVQTVKAMADKGVDKTLITPDVKESNAYLNDLEQEGSELCTLLTRYFRKNGEVYFEKATKSVVINKPKPLNPETIAKSHFEFFDNEEGKDKIDSPTANAPDSELELQEEEIDRLKATLYPINVNSWKPRDKSIFGRGEVEGLIPNQKVVNFNIAMAILNAQELGSPKIVAKQGALQGQVITNEPAQTLIDYYQGNGNGFYPLSIQPFTTGLLQIAPTVLDLTRTVTNSTELITGEALSKDLSGVAIAQLQAQANKNISLQIRSYWRSKEKEGKILEQFFKLYYEDKEFTYELPSDKYQALIDENNLLPEGQRQPVSKIKTEIFNGRDYKDKKFSIIVEAGAGTEYSEIASMQMLDTLLQMDKITFEQYFELYPKTAMPFKAELRAIQRKNEQSENAQLKMIIQNMQQQLQQAGIRIQQQDYELRNNQQYTDNLVKEFEKQFNALKGINQPIQNSQQP